MWRLPSHFCEGNRCKSTGRRANPTRPWPGAATSRRRCCAASASRIISLNPGASYRGLHDSLVNHLGNERPGILLCLHEDHSVAIAHGYAKATGEPMACVLHSNVGLMHGMMGIFNAWCDRVPMIVLGATGPVDAEKRRPWIDWIHTSRDQGALIRSLHQVGRPADLGAGAGGIHVRARNIVTRSAPTAPVYICLDAGFQEARARQGAGMARPDAVRAARAAASVARARSTRRPRCSTRAKRPVIMFGRGSRQDRVSGSRASRSPSGSAPAW